MLKSAPGVHTDATASATCVRTAAPLYAPCADTYTRHSHVQVSTRVRRLYVGYIRRIRKRRTRTRDTHRNSAAPFLTARRTEF